MPEQDEKKMDQAKLDPNNSNFKRWKKEEWIMKIQIQQKNEANDAITRAAQWSENTL